MALQWVDLDGLDSVMTYIWERLALKADKSDLTTAVRFMGSVATYAELPTNGNRVGDMWNVEEDGANYCWKDGGGWDDLSGIIDLSAYYTIAESEAAFVMLTRNQTITGVKTFTESPRIVAGAERGITINRTDKALGGSWAKYRWDTMYDQNGTLIGELLLTNDATATAMSLITYNKDANGDTVMSYLRVHALQDGSIYANAPTPSSASENSTKIATTAWVNLADSVVHKTGIETIAGIKTFVNNVEITREGWSTLNFRSTGYDALDTELTGDPRVMNIESYDMNARVTGAFVNQIGVGGSRQYIRATTYNGSGEQISAFLHVVASRDGSTYATAPATRNTGYGSGDIATAGWVDSKIAAVTATAVTQAQIDAIVARLDALEAAS